MPLKSINQSTNKSNETLGEKVGWELHLDAACCFEQIREAAPYKTAAELPLIPHLRNHPRKVSKACWRNKDELINDVLQWTSTHGHTNVTPTQENLCLSALCGHKVPSRWLTKSGVRLEWMERERERERERGEENQRERDRERVRERVREIKRYSYGRHALILCKQNTSVRRPNSLPPLYLCVLFVSGVCCPSPLYQ